MENRIIHKVGYNSQRDNFDFSGKFKGYQQCFSTSAHMFMSYYSTVVDAGNDDQLAWYLDQVEASIGVRGVAEKVIRFVPGIPSKGSSYWWKVQVAGINEVLGIHGENGYVASKGAADWYDAGSWTQFEEALRKGPVIAGTHKMGGLPGGHIVLVVGIDYQKGTYYLNDPYGNPLSNYKGKQGEGIEVPIDWFRIQCSRATQKNKVRFIYWNEELRHASVL